MEIYELTTAHKMSITIANARTNISLNSNIVFVEDNKLYVEPIILLFTRLFNFPSVSISTKSLAEKLTEYVKDFDELLNIYFSNQANERLAFALVEKRFKELKAGEIVI